MTNNQLSLEKDLITTVKQLITLRLYTNFTSYYKNETGDYHTDKQTITKRQTRKRW